MIEVNLKSVLKKMDIPLYRRDKFNLANLNWLHKNLEIRNSTEKTVAFLNNQGNLKLKGGYVENYVFS